MAFTGLNSSAQAPETAIAHADVVIGLTSHNDARTIGAVIGAVEEGLSSAFGPRTARFVLADARSTDGTREAARAAASVALVEVDYPARRRLRRLPYHGLAGRAAALRAILETAQRLGAAGCAFLDAAVGTVTPAWIQRLVGPVLTDGCDYVSPCFVRRANEGAITKAIVAPMFAALYGVRIRQPAAAEFGCSARLAAHFLEQEFWDVEQAASGIDLWLAAAAAAGQFRLHEAMLGVRTTSREVPSDISTTLAQVVGALFADVEHRVDAWQRTKGVAQIPTSGTVSEVEPSPANADGLIDAFRLGYRELRGIWTWVLPPRTIVELRRLTDAPPERFRFDDRLWATIIYDFAVGYSLRVLPHDHLLRSLTPLYAGWLASFVMEMDGAAHLQIEQRLDEVCRGFEARSDI